MVGQLSGLESAPAALLGATPFAASLWFMVARSSCRWENPGASASKGARPGLSRGLFTVSAATRSLRAMLMALLGLVFLLPSLFTSPSWSAPAGIRRRSRTKNATCNARTRTSTLPCRERRTLYAVVRTAALSRCHSSGARQRRLRQTEIMDGGTALPRGRQRLSGRARQDLRKPG